MILGERVRLRPIERDDLPRFVGWFGDPEVRRHLLVYLPFSLAQEKRWFENLLERLERQEDVVLAIETSGGVHIGNVGLHAIDWKNRNAELGIVIGEQAYWGQGYGTDAIRTPGHPLLRKSRIPARGGLSRGGVQGRDLPRSIRDEYSGIGVWHP